MNCYRVETNKGDIEYVSAVGLSPAIYAGNKLFPGVTIRVREATEAEQAALYAAHSYDGLDAEDFTGV
jgi:hypothetical protein